MRSPKLAALELRRFGRGKLPRAALVALLLLPLLYGALYLWSFWDPYGRLDRIPVALVNDDRGATAGGRKIAAGDEITGKLLDSKVFDWQEVGAEEAEEGVENGRYYLSLTMPSDFSSRIASGSGDSPQTGALQVRTNDANNYLVGQISRSVFSEVRTAASTHASRGFLDKIFLSFSDIHDATEKAAKGAEDLDGGIGKAKKGSQGLVAGLNDAKSGSGSLSGGIKKLDRGAGDLATGARQVAAGTEQLSRKVNGIAGKVRPYLKDDGTSIAHSAQLVADSAKVAGNHLESLVKGAPAAARKARKGANDLAAVHRESCVAVPGAGDGAEAAAAARATYCPALKKGVTAAEEAATVAEDVDAMVGDSNSDLALLDTRLKDIRSKSQALVREAPHLDEDLRSAVAKVDALNSGAQQVSRGAARLHTGLGSARTGAVDLDKGVGRLRTGANDLDGGLFKLADGSGRLAGGLHDGVGKIPDHDKDSRDRRTGVMADPVELASQALHKAPNYGTGFAPYFVPLSLWVGAMVAYMLIQPLNRRALAAGASAWRTAFAGWLPVAALGVLQVAALMSVLHWGLGLEMARTAGTLGFLALTTCCFASIVQWLNARFGAAGRILVLAVLMLQLTSAGGTYPVQTSPPFFQAIHPFLPMTYVVEGLRRLISGGGLEPVWTGSAVLAAFTAGALALTALSARRKQVWTLERLHPELSL
jgi:putative membrane protein